LFPLFLAGIVRGNRLGWIVAGGGLLVLELVMPSGVRENVLPWAVLGLTGAVAWNVRGRKFAVCVWVFLLIFALHSVLWWRGWFGSCGLMRILACVGPITAIICLRGWNVIAELVPRGRAALGAVAIVAMGLSAMGYYVVDPSHQRIFPLQKACDFVTSGGLLTNAPEVVTGDPMAQVCLHLPPNPGNVLQNDCDRLRECQELLRAPIGSVGVWDNQHAEAWFHVGPADLGTLGYSVLFEVRQRPMFAIAWLEPANLPREQVYVVIRKDRVGALPPGV
jgi:hypothetical protein